MRMTVKYMAIVQSDAGGLAVLKRWTWDHLGLGRVVDSTHRRLKWVTRISSRPNAR